MLRLLRRFNKIILVFGGSLLMVLFLVPSIGQRAGGASPGSTIARFDGGKITGKQYQQGQRELEALTIVRSVMPVGDQLGMQSIAGMLGIESVEHWLLLVHMAERAGLVGGVTDATTLLDELSADSSRSTQLPASQVRGMFDESLAAAKRQQPPEIVDRALARAYGVFRLYMSYQGSQPLSRPEMQAIGRRLFDTVITDLMVLPAGNQARALPAPSAERIAEHFAKYKSVRPSVDGTEIGYLRPPAVQIETLRVDRAAVSGLLTINPVDVNTYWRQNRGRFGEDFSSVRAQVEEEFRQREIDRVLQRVREATESRIKLSISSVGRGGEAGAAMTLADVEQVILKTINPPAVLATPVTTLTPGDGQWKTASDLGQMQPIAGSSWTLGAQSQPFAQVVMSLKELGGPPNPLLAPVMNVLKVGVPFGPLADGAGNTFYFRVTQARPESPPESADEVMEQIKSDLAAIDGLESLTARAEEFRKKFVEIGASGMLNTEGLGARLISNVEITRSSLRQTSGLTMLPALNVPEFRDRVMDAVAGWDQMQDVGAKPLDQRVLAIPSKGMRGLVLVEIKGRRPLTREQLKTGEVPILSRAQQDLRDARQVDLPLSYERLSQRLNLRYAGRAAKMRETPAENGSDPSGQTPEPSPSPTTGG